MSDSEARKIFRYQIWHLVSVVALISLARLYLTSGDEAVTGALGNVGTKTWFYIAIIISIIHQTYVWLIWRLELYGRIFTKRVGVYKAFKIYAAGFIFLLVCRILSISVLAISNRNSVIINPYFLYSLVGIIIPVVIYLTYSLFRYFTIKRALGIDHFIENYDQPFVKKGIFRFTNNGMYIFGFIIYYLPGLLLSSRSALAAAVFYHLYIWVHYFCTERPDMKRIYRNVF